MKRGDIIYLIRRNIKTKRPSNKLDFKKLVPFKVEGRISNTNYRLELLTIIRIYLIFYILLLKLIPKTTKLNIIIEIENEEPEYEIETILDFKLTRKNIEYLIK